MNFLINITNIYSRDYQIIMLIIFMQGDDLLLNGDILRITRSQPEETMAARFLAFPSLINYFLIEVSQ